MRMLLVTSIDILLHDDLRGRLSSQNSKIAVPKERIAGQSLNNTDPNFYCLKQIERSSEECYKEAMHLKANTYLLITEPN